MTATALLYADNDTDNDEILYEKITQSTQQLQYHNDTIRFNFFQILVN